MKKKITLILVTLKMLLKGRTYEFFCIMILSRSRNYISLSICSRSLNPDL